MLVIGCLLLYLAIKKGFEPLLLVPIGFGCLLANIPLAGITDEAPPEQEYAIYLNEDFSRDKLVDIVLTKMVVHKGMTQEEAKAAGEKKLDGYAEEFKQSTQSKENKEGKLPFVTGNKGAATSDFQTFLLGKKEIAVAGFNDWNNARCKAIGAKPPSHPYSVTDGFLMMIYKIGLKLQEAKVKGISKACHQ